MDFKIVAKEDMMTWCSHSKRSGSRPCTTKEVDELNTMIERLALLHTYDALVLFRNCFRLPKLLYTLRTSECSDNIILDQFVHSLRDGLTKILHIDLDNYKWQQINLPIIFNGLRIGSGKILAPSAFTASAK